MKITELPLPLLRTDFDGDITFKNDLIVKQRSFAVRKSVMSMLPPESAKRFSALANESSFYCDAIGYNIGRQVCTAFVLSGGDDVIWLFPESLETNRHIPWWEFYSRGICDNVAKAIETILLTPRITLPSLYQKFSYLFPNPTGNTDLITLDSFMRISELVCRFIFRDDRIASSDLSVNDNVFIAKNDAARSLGRMILLLSQYRSENAFLKHGNNAVLIRIGKRLIRIETVKKAASEVGVIKPYGYTALEAVAAISFACVHDILGA